MRLRSEITAAIARLEERTARRFGDVTAPLLVFHSEEDHVVDDATVPLIAERVSSTDLVEQTLRTGTRQ